MRVRFRHLKPHLLLNHLPYSRRSIMSQSSTLFIGMDVQKESISVTNDVRKRHAAVVSLDSMTQASGTLVLEGTRQPTEERNVVANPRIAAGSTVVSYWLCSFQWMQSKETKKMQKLVAHS